MTFGQSLFLVGLTAWKTQHVITCNAEGHCSNIITQTALILLGQYAICLHQRLHTNISGKTVSNVINTFVLPLFGINNVVSAKRALGFWSWAEPFYKAVPTQKVSARKELGHSKAFMANGAVHVAGFICSWSRCHGQVLCLVPAILRRNRTVTILLLDFKWHLTALASNNICFSAGLVSLYLFRE